MRPRLVILLRVFSSWGALALLAAFYAWLAFFSGELARSDASARAAKEEAMRRRQQAKTAEAALETFATAELRERIAAVEARLLREDPLARAEEEKRIQARLGARGWTLRQIAWAPGAEGGARRATIQAGAPAKPAPGVADGRLGEWLRAAGELWTDGPPLEWISYTLGRETRGELLLQAELLYPTASSP